MMPAAPTFGTNKAGKMATPKPPPAPVPAPSPAAAAPEYIPRPIRADAIVSRICASLSTTAQDLGSQSRHPRVVWGRMLITRMARVYTTLSYPEIARLIGRPNHSSVITSDQRLSKILRLPKESAYRMMLDSTVSGVQSRDVVEVMEDAARSLGLDPAKMKLAESEQIQNEPMTDTVIRGLMILARGEYQIGEIGRSTAWKVQYQPDGHTCVHSARTWLGRIAGIRGIEIPELRRTA